MSYCFRNGKLKAGSIQLLLSSCAVLAPLGASAYAQELNELPPMLVEGATVDKPKVNMRKSTSGQNTMSPQGGQGEVAPGDATAEAAGGVPADEVGSSVTVVTSADLKAQNIRHAADALRSLPGVSVNRSGGFGSLTQVRIRGAEGNHTLVLIDGIDAGDTSSGEFDFSNLLVEDIERIEVIRGGQSGIGGSKAIGGVINVITKNGKGPLTFTARAEGGSFNTREIAGRVSAGNDKFWFALSGNVRDFDGFNLSQRGSESDPWRLGTFNAKGGAAARERRDARFLVAPHEQGSRLRRLRRGAVADLLRGLR